MHADRASKQRTQSRYTVRLFVNDLSVSKNFERRVKLGWGVAEVIHYFNSDEAYHASRVLQADLDKICKFSHDHNLDINPDKTKVSILCHNGVKADY
nr:unnamed protein product [Callosobruchus chinensis]